MLIGMMKILTGNRNRLQTASASEPSCPSPSVSLRFFCIVLNFVSFPIFGEADPSTLTADKLPALAISANHRYLAEALTGKPFFLLADTAWNLDALTDEEIDTYLQDRHSHRFNTVMFCLNFFPQASAENAYGQRAYIGTDNTELNPEYFIHVDRAVNTAASLHLYVMLYAMWGGSKSGTMNTYTPDQLHLLGERLGKHFRAKSNVILCAGGESTPPYVDVDRVNAIGSGLKEGCDGKNLVVVHPCSNRSSSQSLSESPWLDIFMSQVKSGRGGETVDMTPYVASDFARSPAKPSMLVEHRYEVGTNEDPVIQRRSLYLSVFAGGCGYAYGHNALWQMSPHTAQKWMLTGWNPGVSKWSEALDTAAVDQLHHIAPLLQSRPYFGRIADQSLILEGQSKQIAERVAAARDGTPNQNDATYLFAYMASPKPITLNASVLSAKTLNITWFDPATGTTTIFKSAIPNPGKLEIPEPPAPHDWVVIVDDASKHYPVSFRSP